MPYTGWKIFAYQHGDGLPFEEKASKRDLLDTIRERFSDANWITLTTLEGLILTHVPTQFEVKVVIHGWKLPMQYNIGPKTETYLVLLESECLAWKQIETDHKRLMNDVLIRLPWRKAAGYVDDGHLDLRYDSNAEPRTHSEDPQRIKPERLAESPIRGGEEAARKRKSVRLHVVRRVPRRPKRGKKTNALRDLIQKVQKERRSSR